MPNDILIKIEKSVYTVIVMICLCYAGATQRHRPLPANAPQPAIAQPALKPELPPGGLGSPAPA